METNAEATEPEVDGALRRRVRKRLWWSIAAGAMALLCCGGVVVYIISLTLSASDDWAMNTTGCGSGDTVDVNGPLPSVRHLNKEQMGNAATIVQTGQKLDVPPRGWIIAVATSMQESTLHNYGNLGTSNDHDSLGLFQQRPSKGWGTPDEVTDPVHASTSFYKSLRKIPHWQELDLTVAAQTVQRSAFPDAYAKWEPMATDVVNSLTDGAGRAAADNGKAGSCAKGAQIAASGWTAPVKAPIVSGFRPPDRPTHYGVDLGAKRGTDIHAASGGVVITVECNASLNGAPYSCDKDGSVSVLGCGWYVEVKHADNIITRYCHMQEHPYVKVGQKVQAGEVLGISGTSGNSSGPHVHFEVHTGGDVATNDNAIDPIPFMEQQGVKLGK
ncbi:MAG TPA: M23 family metallopeptidase [Stackebrandtia sp.]|jgi:murein DD-endopeptidase MepM/ murein hydrolase activator NlpD|uniref:M23 family metallopeptidase n=1 Tax=Stackebrandtia sp. TaxID=2023065 RepID=UPI002D2C64A0|nr:M23 family metallopeptidase [Stackebrandtia sp.]HZE40909.1 M23 family metallopeptidase [Stackebrandtia sp.]